MKYKTQSNLVLAGFLALIAAIVAGAVGWIINIVEIAQTSPFVLDGELVLRIAGIFIVPLGAIMGLFV